LKAFLSYPLTFYSSRQIEMKVVREERESERGGEKKWRVGKQTNFSGPDNSSSAALNESRRKKGRQRKRTSS
jgi:hypothetical protein